MTECDVLIIGGGPAGSIAAAKLVQEGYHVEVIEKVKFPRFVIGESLLPECNQLLEDANMLDKVIEADFQFKGGVAFQNDTGNLKVVDFKNNLGQKWNSSFQVRREVFDKILLDDAQEKGAKVTYESEVIDYDEHANVITVKHLDGSTELYHAKKVIDASGYGHVLPRLLGLVAESQLEMRDAIFCRMKNDIRPEGETAGFIYVYVVGDNDAWIWNIPFNDGVTSVGIVCTDAYYRSYNMNQTDFFNHIIANNKLASARYASAEKVNDVGFIGGYSSNVTTMFGKNFVLVGNATEFLDPVFSSGVTLALESGAKAAELTAKELGGESVDWLKAYQEYMMIGVDVFREYVNAWYDGRLQTILFSKKEGSDKIEQKIVSVLSGHVWDETNMFVNSPTAAVNATYRALSDRD